MATPNFPVERARALLERLIPDGGSAPARKVHEAARRAGVPEWAIRKARKSLEIEVRFVGFGGNGWWEWRWAKSWTWRPPAPPAPSPPVCAWPCCTLAPRSKKATYCAIHKPASVRRNKREWARKDRALLCRARKRLAQRVDRVRLRAAGVVGTPVPEPPSECLQGNLPLLDAEAKPGVRKAAMVNRSHPRLSVRLGPGLMDRVTARAHTEGISVSVMLRKSLEAYTEDVGPEGVMIRLTPYYREQLVKRLGEYPGQEPGAVLERFMQLALDGSWLMTDREG